MATETKAAQPAPTGTGFAITSLVTGIVGVLLALVPFIGFLLGATAVVFGALGIKRTTGRGLAVAGLVTGSVAVLIGLVVFTFWVIAIAVASSQPSYYYY